MNCSCGDILKNKYILIKQIGYGQFSEVWLGLCYDKLTYVAIKIFDKDNIKTQKNEINALRQLVELKCQYCVSFVEYFKYNNLFCIVQELMVASLYSIMKSQYPNGFPDYLVKQIIISLLKAISVIHQKLQIVHADIKPENILLVGHSIEVDEIIQTIGIPKNKKRWKLTHDINKLASHIKQLFNEQSNDDLLDVVGSESGTSSDILSDNESNEVNTDSDIASSRSSSLSRDCLTSNDDSSDDSNEVIKIVDEKYLINPRIVLADFGNCIKLQDGKIIGYGDIQTRHYRAPEIILRLEQTEKCDIWAIGCVAYELLTGKVLFEPNKTTNITTDLKQLYDIQCLLGIFSENMFTGRKNDIFFKNNFFIKKFDKLNHVDFKTLLQKNISNNTLTTTTLDIISDFLLNCLTLDQSHRPSASVLLTHTYLTS